MSPPERHNVWAYAPRRRDLAQVMMDALDPVVEHLWFANQARTGARFVDVLAVLDAVASGVAVDVEPGINQAHILAGLLGTYGRPGSDLMKYVEQALREPLPAAQGAELATRVRRLLGELALP